MKLYNILDNGKKIYINVIFVKNHFVMIVKRKVKYNYLIN